MNNKDNVQGVAETLPLMDDAPDLTPEEAKLQSMQQAYDDLSKIKDNLETAGEISQEQIVSLEQRFPGILTDNYPPGGYQGENIKLAMESVNLQQTAIIGGIVAVVVGLILAILKAIGFFFKSSSGSSSSRSENSKESVAKIKETVTDIKDADKDLDDAVKEISRSNTMSPEDFKQFVVDINAILGVQLSTSMSLEQVVDKATEHADDLLVGSIEDNCSQNAAELLKSERGEVVIPFSTAIVKMVPEILNKVDADIKYIKQFEKPVSHTDVPSAKPYVYNNNLFAELQKLSMNRIKIDPNTFNTDLLYNAVLTTIDLSSPKKTAKNLNFSTHQEIEKWCFNIDRTLEKLVIPDEHRRIDKLMTELDDLLKKHEQLQRGSTDNFDRERFRSTAEYLQGVLKELRILNACLIRVEQRVAISLGSFVTICRNGLSKRLAVTERIAKLVLKLSKTDPATHDKVKKKLDEWTS